MKEDKSWLRETELLESNCVAKGLRRQFSYGTSQTSHWSIILRISMAENVGARPINALGRKGVIKGLRVLSHVGDLAQW